MRGGIGEGIAKVRQNRVAPVAGSCRDKDVARARKIGGKVVAGKDAGGQALAGKRLRLVAAAGRRDHVARPVVGPFVQ